MLRRPLAALALALVLAACGTTRPLPPLVNTDAPADVPDAVTLTVLQLNDVYEITPVEGGRSGGLARVAWLRQQLMEEDPDVLTVIGGDFVSPSALGTARVDGNRLNGRQMVAVLNTMGLDLAVLGNHEFDLSEEDFRARVSESRFTYVCANTTEADGSPFPRVLADTTFTVTDAGGTARVSVTGVVLASNPKPYVVYSDPVAAMEAGAARLAGADALLGLTHLAFDQDVQVAEGSPAYDLIMGGHEHENIDARRGPDFTPIRKADANARTVWVHRLRIDPATDAVTVHSELVEITDAMPEDPATAAEVARWVDLAYAGFRADGFEPTREVTTTTDALDGREATVRNRPGTLTDLIMEGYFHMAQDAGAEPEIAVFNGGSVRIDDVLPPGPVSEYDVIRVLPFGGNVLTVEIRGATLDSVLTQGVANRGTGGYLQTYRVTRDSAENGTWLIDSEPIEADRTYRVVTGDFLVSGRETGLGFLNAETNPNVHTAATHGDVRQAVIAQLRRQYGGG